MMWDSIVGFIMAVQYRTVIFSEIPAIQNGRWSVILPAKYHVS